MTTAQVQFFWQNGGRQKSRFNLLLLEYGEHFYEDLSVFWLPMPSSSRTIQQCDSLKTQGRLKVCSRSLIFEPIDIKRPIIRYSFKNMTSDPKEYGSNIEGQCMFASSGFITFSCSSIIEMKANGKVGPYKQVDDVADQGKVLFALVHSDPCTLLSKVKSLMHIYSVLLKDGQSMASRMKLPYSTFSSNNAFDTSLLVSFHETLLFQHPIPVKKVSPMIINPGSLMITDSRIYYQPDSTNNVDEIVQSIDIRSIQRLYCRRYLLKPVGIEVIMSETGVSWLFCFDDVATRDKVYDIIQGHPRMKRTNVSLSNYTKMWQKKEISNFEYLMFVNYEAGRSANDIAQYPVFPHIIRDFTSKTLDLKDPNTFRDLSKPVGALNPTRLEHFKERYESLKAVSGEGGGGKLTTFGDDNDDESGSSGGNSVGGSSTSMMGGIPPPFMYGTHYSTPGYVLYYLVRVAPEHMLCLQAGKFDSADRMFISISESWDSCYVNPADLKELIPEFFIGNGDFLLNKASLELGFRQTGERLGDVELPPWAKNPKDFIKKNIKALESSYVSEHLHEWIDLIFGYKQRGKAAEEADNVFYHLTYEGAVNLDELSDANERAALEIQIQEFGQTPKQLFSEPHPSRFGARSSSPPSANASSLEYDRMNMTTPPPHMNCSVPNSRSTSPVPNIEDVSIADTTNDAILSSPEESTPIVVLDDDFKMAVERELSCSKLKIISDNDAVKGKRNAPASGTPNPSTPNPSTNPNSSASIGNNNNNMFDSAVKGIFNFFGKSKASGEASSTGSNGAPEKAVPPTSSSNGVNNSPSSTAHFKKVPVTLAPINAVDSVSPTPNGVSPGWRGRRAGEVFIDPTAVVGSPLPNSGNQSRNTSSDLGTSTSTSSFPPTDGKASLMEDAPGSSRATANPVEISLVLLDNTGNSGNSKLGYKKSGNAVHSKSITTLAVDHSSFSNNNSNSSIATVIALCTCSMDGYVKMLHIEVNRFASSVKYHTKRTFSTSSTLSSVVLKSTGAGHSICNCALISNDGKSIVAGGSDSNLYSFSVPSAGIMGKHMLHDDSISSIAMTTGANSTFTLLATGSIDASIKVWKLANTSNTTNSSRGGFLSLSHSSSYPCPVTELFEHDNAISSLAVMSTSIINKPTTLLAAGAGDGVIIVWDISESTSGMNTTGGINSDRVLFSCQVSGEVLNSSRFSNIGTGGKSGAVTSVHWLPELVYPAYCGMGDNTSPKLVCCTNNGYLVCMDMNGRLLAATYVTQYPISDGSTDKKSSTRGVVGICCLCVEKRKTIKYNNNHGIDVADEEAIYVYGGCNDGSIRVWTIECVDSRGEGGGCQFVEKFCFPHAHVNNSNENIEYENYRKNISIKSIALGSEHGNNSVLITGGDDGSMFCWSINATISRINRS